MFGNIQFKQLPLMKFENPKEYIISNDNQTEDSEVTISKEELEKMFERRIQFKKQCIKVLSKYRFI
jgi:hypothetical protein